MASFAIDASGPGQRAARERGHDAQADVAEDLTLDVRARRSPGARADRRSRGARRRRRCGRARRVRAQGSCPPMSSAIAARSLSSVVCATRHPSFTSPIRSVSGTRTSVKNTSLKCAPPVICRSGRTSMPGVLHVEHEVGDPVVLRHARVGADEQHAPAASGARPTTTPSGRSRSSRRRRAPRVVRSAGEVGARAGLAEELAPDLLAAEQRPEPAGAADRRCRARSGSGRRSSCRCGTRGRARRTARPPGGRRSPRRSVAAATAVLARPRDRGPAVVGRARLPRLRAVDALDCRARGRGRR